MRPPIFYKYRADSDFTAKIITDRKVWMSTPDKLNDPQECKTGIIPEDWKRTTIRKMEEAQIMGAIGAPGPPPRTLFSYDPRRTRKWVKRLLKLPHEKRVREIRALYREHGVEPSDPRQLFETFQAQLLRVGIFSMSECDDIQPMWTHYADEHKGLVLGFAVRDGSKLDDPNHTLPVTYSDGKPTFDSGFLHKIVMRRTATGFAAEGVLAFDDPVLRATVSTKPAAWSYEREWRYVEEVGGAHEFPGELVSVVYGLRMPGDRRAHYDALLARSGFDIVRYEARLSADGSFQVTRRP